MKLKNSNHDTTKNSNCDETQKIVMKLENSHFDETQQLKQ